MKKKVIITGEKGYIGSRLYTYLERDNRVCRLGVRKGINTDELKDAGVVIHAAGIVHQPARDITKEQYKAVNTELTIRLAEKCKQAGVKHFIFISTMAVYAGTKRIGKSTVPMPDTMYGSSKLEAENAILAMADDSFMVSVIRPPMVYGENCPGNYSRLKRLARYAPVFPDSNNKRSMISIENLCGFIEEIIKNPVGGIFHPQDPEYINTGIMYKKIREENGRKTILLPLKIFRRIELPIIQKIFGDLYYSSDIDG